MASQKRERITFTIVDPDAPKGEWRSKEDPSPYFGLTEDKMTRSVGWLQNPEEVVIDKPSIRVSFSYPLAEEHILTIRPLFGQTNFTRAGLAKAIAVQYQIIYAEEEKSANEPTESIGDRVKRLANEMPEDTDEQRAAKLEAQENASHCFLMNRARTTGTWGIWGHDLSDLDLHTVTYDPEQDVYYLGIDS